MINLIKFRFCLLVIVSLFACIPGITRNIEISLLQLPLSIKSVEAGDTIFILPGTYSDTSIKLNHQFSQKIVIRPKIFGSVIIKKKTVIKFYKCKNIKIEGFLFQEIEGNAILLNESNNIEISNNYFLKCGTGAGNSLIRMLNGTFDNIISYNTFDDSRSQGIAMITSKTNPKDSNNTNNRIFRNYFCNTPAVQAAYPNTHSTNGMEAMMIGTAYDNTLHYNMQTAIFQNLFENIIGDRREIMSIKSSGNIIDNNTFLNNLSGLTIRGGYNVKIINNYFSGTKGGIRIFGSGHNISNNYIENSNDGIRLPSGDSYYGGKLKGGGYMQQDNITIAQNIIINPKNAGISLGDGNLEYNPQNIKISGNKMISGKKQSFIKKTATVKSASTQNNQIIESDKLDPGQIQDAKNIWLDRIKSEKKLSPFNSNDPEVGATWKRPVIVSK